MKLGVFLKTCHKMAHSSRELGWYNKALVDGRNRRYGSRSRCSRQ
jgi:hypothetical protein